MEFIFEKIDIATGNLEAMVAFYAEVFGIHFTEINETIGGKPWTLYLGNLGGLKFFLCPAEPSGTKIGQEGVHQFHLRVRDINEFVTTAMEKGHKIDEVPFGAGSRNFCLRDPDGHPWIISQ